MELLLARPAAWLPDALRARSQRWRCVAVRPGRLPAGATTLVGGGGLLRFAATRALPAALAFDVGKQAVTGSSPIRSYADTRGSYRGFSLPTTGGGFKSMMRDLEHWSLQQPEWETKARKFGDTLQGLGARVSRLDSSSLRRMASDARAIARNFDPASTALRARSATTSTRSWAAVSDAR